MLTLMSKLRGFHEPLLDRYSCALYNIINIQSVSISFYTIADKMLGTVKRCSKFRWPVAVVKQNSCQLSSAAPAVKWDIFAAVCIERPPYITPPLSEIERKTVELLKQKEYEESMLNDHELRHK